MVGFQRVRQNKTKPSQKSQKKPVSKRNSPSVDPQHASEQERILHLQGTVGNQAVLQMMRQGTIEQPKSAPATVIQRMPGFEDARGSLPDSAGEGMAERKLVIVNMIKDYNQTIANYSQNFPKTPDEARQKAEPHFQKTVSHLHSLYDGIFSSLKAMKTYFTGQMGKKRLTKGKQRKGDQKHQVRVDQIQAFAKRIERKYDILKFMNEIHHQAMMSVMTGQGGLQHFTAEDVVGGVTGDAAKGGVHTLGKGQLDTRGRGVKTGYFKSDEATPDDAGRGIDIKSHEGKQSLRSVATYRVNELLEMGIIPYTALTRGKDEKGQTTTGQFMEEAKGFTGRGKIIDKELQPETTAKVKKLLEDLKQPDLSKKQKKEIEQEIEDQVGLMGHKEIDGKIYKLKHAAADVDWMTPVIQKDLSTLQLFDIIVGHADRHAENFIVETGMKGVKGIDNDSVWGSRIGKKEMGQESGFEYKKAMKTPGLPPVLDAQIALKVVSTPWKSIENILVQHAMKSSEITAAQGRWEFVQEKVKAMILANQLATMGMDEGEQVFVYMDLYDAIGEQLPPNLEDLRLKVWGIGTEEDMKTGTYIENMNTHYDTKVKPEDYV